MNNVIRSRGVRKDLEHFPLLHFISFAILSFCFISSFYVP